MYNTVLLEKIPKESSEVVNRRTDNIMTKRKNNDIQNITQKTKNRAAPTPLKTRFRKFLLHTWYPSCYFCYKRGDKS